jgi:hypothetical protein
VSQDPVLIEFNGGRYWLMSGFDVDDAVAYTNQCDQDGNLMLSCLDSHSSGYGGFAYWFPERDALVRHGIRIGGRKDMHPVIKPPQ